MTLEEWLDERKGEWNERKHWIMFDIIRKQNEALTMIQRGYSGTIGINSQGLSGTDCKEIAEECFNEIDSLISEGK